MFRPFIVLDGTPPIKVYRSPICHRFARREIALSGARRHPWFLQPDLELVDLAVEYLRRVNPSTYWLCSSCATRVKVWSSSSFFLSRKNPPPVSSESRLSPRSGLIRTRWPPFEVLVLQADRVHHHLFDPSRGPSHRPSPSLLALSSPSVNTSTTLRPVGCHSAASMLSFDRVVETRRIAEVELLQRAHQLSRLFGEAVWMELDLVVERADHALVFRQQPEQELLRRRSFTRSSASVMLPLVSSITTTVIGGGWLSNCVSVCSLPLS